MLTNLRSVWSGSKDLLADWRVKLLPVLLLHFQVTKFVKIPLTEFAFEKAQFSNQVCVMIHITGQDSYNHYFCTFFIVHEVV